MTLLANEDLHPMAQQLFEMDIEGYADLCANSRVLALPFYEEARRLLKTLDK